MIDNVLVTLINNGREFDIELPANVKVELLKPVLVEALSRKGSRPGSNFNLSSNGNILKDSDTLFSAGVWDGSYLTIA